MVECGVSILAACLPSLQILFRGYSWDTFVDIAKSLFRYNSRPQFHKASENTIHVSHGYNIAYTENNNSFSNSELVLPITDPHNQQPKFRTETYVMKDLRYVQAL